MEWRKIRLKLLKISNGLSSSISKEKLVVQIGTPSGKIWVLLEMIDRLKMNSSIFTFEDLQQDFAHQHLHQEHFVPVISMSRSPSVGVKSRAAL